jgi:hypothetical protein
VVIQSDPTLTLFAITRFLIIEKNLRLARKRHTYRELFLTLNIALCSVLKNPGQCIESVCYATNLYSTHPWLLNFEIMLKIVPIDGIGLSE